VQAKVEVVIFTKSGTDVQHLHQMSLLASERSRS